MNPQDPTQNIFAYGGNSINAQTGQATPQPSSITSSVLQPTTPISYSTPNPTPVPSVASLDTNYQTPQLAATPQEQNATDMSSRIQALNTQMTGKSAYTTDQQNAAGLPTLDKNQQDLTTQLQQLKNEALAIPQQLQLDSTGRGITAAGLAPLQTARLRTNSIAALGISSLLDATNGLISSANQKVQQAVAAKYDPIQEQIDAATKNLNLVMNSPDYTLAEKNRAQTQLDAQKQKADQLAKNKQDAATIQSWAAAALTNGAKPLDAQKIMQIGQSDNPDLNKAFQLYAPYAKDPNATQKAINDLAQQRAQLGLTQAQTTKAQADAAKAVSEINNQGDTVNGLAQQLVAGTLAPSELSKRATGASSYNDVLVAAGKLTGANGKPFDIAKADRQYKFANQPNTQNTLNFLTSLVGGPGRTGNLDELKNLSSQVNNPKGGFLGMGSSSFPALNDVNQWASISSGDPTIAAYHAVITEVADQIAKILQGGGSGSGTSDAKLKQAAGLFQTGFTKDQMTGVIDAIKPLLANRASSMISDNPYLKDYADQLGIGQNGKTPAVGASVQDATNIPEGATAVGSDGKNYVAKGGKWVPQ